MADEQPDTNGQAESLPTVYYRIDDGGAVAREREGWERQIWRPSLQEWVDAGEINFATEAREISMTEAVAETGTNEEAFGEFAPEPRATETPDADRP